MKFLLYLTIITLFTKKSIQYNYLIFDEDDLESLIDLTPQNDKKAKIVLSSIPLKMEKNNIDESKINNLELINKNTILNGHLDSKEIQKIKMKQLDISEKSEENFYSLDKIFLFIIGLYIM